jgi:hypothetical protein
VTGGRRKVYKEELRDLYSSNVIRNTKLKLNEVDRAYSSNKAEEEV